MRGRVEDAGGVGARAAEDGVLERGELGLLVPDVVLERGDVLADGNCGLRIEGRRVSEELTKRRTQRGEIRASVQVYDRAFVMADMTAATIII